MGISPESLGRAQGQICDRIDRIARELPHLTVSRLASEVDELRRIATDYGFVPVVALARGLESALAGSCGGVMILPFLETMRDAAISGRLDNQAAETFLASVNQRRYG